MTKYTIITSILIVASIVYLKLAERFNIIDKPNERSSHTISTIRGGGILFLIGAWLFFLFSDFQYPYLISGVTLIAIISFVDDIKTLSSKLRLPFQFIAVFLVLMQVGFPFSPIYVYIIAIICGVGFINLYNFMDGINGITGLYSLAVLFGIYIVNNDTQLIHPDLIRYLMLSILIFGYYNFRKKARFFAGDIGSISIAVLLFFMIVYFMYVYMAPVFVLWIAVYGIDGCLTIAYRKKIGEKIMEPHRLHIYQKVVDTYKTPHLKISISYAVLQIIIGLIVYKTYVLSLLVQAMVVFIVLLVLTVLYVLIFHKTKRTLNSTN